MQEQYSHSFRLTTSLIVIIIATSACTPHNRLPELTPAAMPSVTFTPNLIQKQTMAAANATPTPVPSPTPWPIASMTPTAVQTDLALQGLNPLTGLPITDKIILQQRPILVKIANWPQNLRPAAGLNQADLVFEYYIGHQMNHFLAVYFGNEAEQVGPLAPARMVDSRLTEHYQGILAYASADNTVSSILAEVLPERAFLRGFTPCPAMCNLTDVSGENTYVNISAMRELYRKQNPEPDNVDLSGFSFESDLSHWDAVAQQLSFLYADFSVMQWDYDPESGKYRLSQDYAAADGSISIQPSFDRVDNAPIAFENIVVLFTNYIEYGTSLYDIDFREGDPNQRALIMRDGKLLYGTWMTPDPFSPISLYDNLGQPLPLKPGRTWFIFTGSTTPATEVEPGMWEMQFSVK